MKTQTVLRIGLLFILGSRFATFSAVADEVLDQYSVASAHYSAERWDMAVEDYRQFIKRFPDHKRATDAKFFLLESLTQLKRYDEAEEIAQRFFVNFPNHTYSAQVLYRWAELTMLQGDNIQSLKLFKEFNDLYPSHDLGQYVLTYIGRLSEHNHDYTTSARFLNKSLAAFPNGATAAEAHLRLGIQAFGEKEFGKAKSHFEWIENNPATSSHQTTALYWQGITLLAEKDYDAAAKILVDAERLDESGSIAPAAMFFSGESYRLSGDLDRADTIFANGLKQWPGSDWADDSMCRRIEIATLTKKHDVVDKHYSEFQKRFPDSDRVIEANQFLARSLLLRSQFSRALTLMENTLSISQDVAPQQKHLNRLRYLAGLSHLGLKNSERAIQVLSQITKQNSSKSLIARTRLALGVAYLELKEREKALSYFKTARVHLSGIALDRCQAHLIRSLVEMKMIDQAIDELEHLQQSYVDDEAIFDSLSRVANHLLSTKDYKRAEIRFRQLANAQKTVWRVAGLSGLGMCLYQLEEFDSAVTAFESIMGLPAKETAAAQAYIMKARCLEKLGQLELASEAYEEVERRFPESALAVESLLLSAKLLITIGKTERGIAFYEKIVQRFPDLEIMDEVLYQWAWALIDDGRIEDADGVFSRIYLEFPSSRFWSDATYRLAEQSLHRKNYDRANQLVDAILTDQNVNEIGIGAHVLFLKARIMAEQNRWEDSITPLQTVISEFNDHKLAVDARFWLAEAYYRMKDFTEARIEFQNLLTENLHEDKATWEPVVYLRNAQIYGVEKNWTQAIRLSDALFERFPDFPQTYEANYLVGRSYARLANFAKARESFQKVIESEEARKTETAAMAQWMIGESYFHQKDYDAAIRAYLRGEVAYDFPNWRSKSLLQAAKCYELLGDTEESQRLLQKIVTDFGGEESAQRAKELLRDTSS